MNWVNSQGYGGAFIWSLDTDDFNGQCPGTKDGNILWKLILELTELKIRKNLKY